jgi:hypothetical protein
MWSAERPRKIQQHQYPQPFRLPSPSRSQLSDIRYGSGHADRLRLAGGSMATRNAHTRYWLPLSNNGRMLGRLEHWKESKSLFLVVCSTTPRARNVTWKRSLRQMNSSLASVHTTVMASTYCLLELCRHPEYIEPLLEEAKDCMSKDQDWARHSTETLPMTDSFICKI